MMGKIRNNPIKIAPGRKKTKSVLRGTNCIFKLLKRGKVITGSMTAFPSYFIA
jgi:hypothetical protein